MLQRFLTLLPPITMRRFDIDCRLDYEVDAPAHFLFHIEAARAPGQELMHEDLRVTPQVEVRHFEDAASGNRFFRFDAPVGRVGIRYRAQVGLDPLPATSAPAETMIAELPGEVLHLLTPTRYCESNLLESVAAKLFGAVPPGVGRVQAISDWVRENVEYRIGSSDTSTTARDVFVQRQGVCRDFAHLGIALCRAMNVPARLVVGYVKFDEPPPDFHAVFEAWVCGGWRLFDPTGLAPVDRLVRVGTGRDAKDVAFSTIYGAGRMISMSPEIEELT